MASPQRSLPPDPHPQPYVDTSKPRNSGRGPGFRWWWLWAVVIAGVIVWYLGFHWNDYHHWYQHHFSNPASTGPIRHPVYGTSAEGASQPGSAPRGSDRMSRGEAAETGNGQAQSTGPTAPQTAPHGNAEVGHAGNQQPPHR